MDNLKKVIEAEAEKYANDKFPYRRTTIGGGGHYAEIDGNEELRESADEIFTAGCNFMAEYLQKQFDEQRAKIAGGAFDAGVDSILSEYRGDKIITKQQYLSSLNSKEND